MRSYTNAEFRANAADLDAEPVDQLTVRFFDCVLPDSGMRCAGYPTARKFEHVFVETNGALAAEVAQLDSAGESVYFGCASYINGSSRKATNVAAVRSFWFDIDTQEGKPKEHYADRKEAAKAVLEFYKELGLPRPLLVSSGYGLHGYSPISEDMAREVWEQTAHLFKKAMKVWGLKADPTRTADVASVLRPVGTHNYKNGGCKDVKLVLTPP